jgi:DNA-binding transcriptional LysR family regulator
VRFIVRTDFFDPLMRELRSGELDVVIGLSMTPPPDALHSWAEEVVWVRGLATRLETDRLVALVFYGKPCVYHRLAVTALKSAGLDWEDVFTGPSMNSLEGAIAAGLGVMAVTRRRASEIGLFIWDDAPLPKLPDLYAGIYIRESGTRAIYEQLADEIGIAINASHAGVRKILAVAGRSLKTGSAA